MKLKNENIDNNLGEKKKLLDIIDSLYLNRISDKELTNITKLTNGGQSKVKIGNYYDMKVIIKVLHNLNVRDYTTEVIHSYKYRHPSIPKFLGVYESFKEIGLVFEYAEGQTLNKLISNERNGKFHMPLLIKIDYLIQLANVIEFLHDNHLIHRDLKTENVVIDYLGNLYLLDFGIAIPDTKNYIDMNSNDYSLTPNYIPPEIVRQAVSLGNEEENSCPELELIKITNKYDIWTFGVIMAELFTRCPPWCNKEKGVKPDEFQIRSLILKHVEYPIPKIYPESDYEKMIRHVVRKCLIYDENERSNIKEIKKDLNIILNCEMIKTNKNIKFDALKELNVIKNEIKDSGKGNFKNNKILGKKICIKEINDLNMRFNCNNKFNIHESNSSEFSLILSDYIKNKCSSYFSSTNTENSITDGLKKLILYKNQKLKILQHKKREMQMKVQELTNKSQIYENLSTNNYEKSQFIFKTYYYMIYDDFNQKILIYEPLKNELKSVDFELINKNLSYKNPFCLNYDEKLFIIGGFIMDTQIKNQLNQIIQSQTLRINFNYFDDFQKSNSYFVPTNICFYYDPTKEELKALPVLVYNRANHSCIIFQKKFLWVIGGNTKLCEVLNIKNISNAKFDKTFFHPGYELIQITTNPLLLNYNDEFILSLDSKYESQSNLNNSFINIQVFNYITNKWNVEKIHCILDNINCFYNFLGCYHNKDEPQDLIIFADVTSDNTQSNFNFPFKESKIIKFDLNYLSNQFKLSLNSCYKNEVELFQIYNSIYIYEFDNDAYYYSFDNFQNKVTLAKTHLRCNIK